MKSGSEFEQWLAAATGGLSRPVRQRLHLELASHYQDAVDAGIADGLSKEEASAKALQTLGEPKAAREVFLQEYPLQMPWEGLDLFPAKPGEHPYGFVRGNELVPCSKEDLIQHCRGKEFPLTGFELVWTPEAERAVPVESVPFLLDALKEGKTKYAKRELWHSLPYAILFGWVVANYEKVAAEDSTWAIFSVFFLFCLLGQSFIALRLLFLARRMQPHDLAMERDAYAFGEWAFEHIWNSLKVSRFTPALFGVWLLVAWAQFFSWVVHDDYSVAINNAGLLPAAVFEGQWWRFATAVHISTGVLPLIPAIGVLLFYGTLMEAFLGRAFVPIVFSVSATAGLCLGLFFADPPTGFTAGALGLVGCLLVAARHDPRLKRLNHVTSFPLIITFFALASLLFFNWSDSIVNLGGFAAGAGLGHLFSRFKTAVSEKRWFQWTGWLAGGFLLASGIAACVLIIMNA